MSKSPGDESHGRPDRASRQVKQRRILERHERVSIERCKRSRRIGDVGGLPGNQAFAIVDLIRLGDQEESIGEYASDGHQDKTKQCR